MKMRCSNLYCACGPQGVLTTPWMVGSDLLMSEFSQSCPAIFTFPNYKTKEFNAESCLNVKKLGSSSRLHQYSVVLKLVASVREHWLWCCRACLPSIHTGTPPHPSPPSHFLRQALISRNTLKAYF